MEDDTDYLMPEFLYLLAFKECPIVIRPFTYRKNLDKILKVLGSIFEIMELDASVVSNPENYDLLLSCYQERYEDSKKKLVVIANLSDEILKILPKYKIMFLAVESNEDLDYVPFDRIAIYDKKKGSFALTYPDDLLSPTPCFTWCKKQCESIKGLGLEKNRQYLTEIYQAAQHLVDIVTNYTSQAYYNAFKCFTHEERQVIHALCTTQFDIATGGVLPNDDAAFFSGDKTPTMEPPLEGQDKQHLLMELAQINTDHPDYYFALTDILQKIPVAETFASPGDKFYFLKTRIWDKYLPIKLLEQILLLYSREQLKRQKISQAGLLDAVQKWHTTMIKVFASIGAERHDFTKIDTGIILQDPFIANKLMDAQKIPLHKPNLTEDPNLGIPRRFDEKEYTEIVAQLRANYQNTAFGIKQLQQYVNTQVNRFLQNE